jgi:hypothetical protein
MAIELSTLTFTDEDDIVPASGMAEIHNTGGTTNTLAGNDIITGILNLSGGFGGAGIYNDASSNIETSDGNDIITGIDNTGVESNMGIYNNQYSLIDTGDGNDTITGTASGVGFRNNQGTIETGKGEDIIIGSGIFGYGISNEKGFIYTGDGNDIILGIGIDSFGIYNSGIIDTGDGNDLIISTGVIYNSAGINTGNGNDSIIGDGGFQLDRIGFMDLGEGEDYINGFGGGVYFGGSGNDILELTPGSYTVQVSPGPISFVKNDLPMVTYGFDKLIAGSTSYDFTSLTQGQTITVA